MGKTGRPRAKENTAKEKAREMDINEEVKRGVNPRNVDVFYVGEALGLRVRPECPQERGAARPRSESKDGTLRNT